MFLHYLSNFFQGTRGMQYVSALIASLLVTATQTHLSWPSPTIPKITGDDSPLGDKVSGDDASWMVSTLILSSLPMSAMYHIVVARFTRKQYLQVASVTLFLSWFLIMFADDIAYLYAARVIAGLFFGTSIMTCALYCSEIADVDIRGKLGTFHGVMKLSGGILVLSIGPFVSYLQLAVVLAIIPFLLFCLLFFIPDSPHSLVKLNRIEEAREAIKVLSGSSEDIEIDKRINTIVNFVQTAEKPMDLRAVLKEWKYFKPIVCLTFVVTMEYMGGFLAITAYQQDIIDNSQSTISPEISSIIFGFIQIPAAVISAFLVDRLGRKKILYIGCTGCMLALITEGFYFYLETYQESDVSSIAWLPTTGLVIYLIMHAIHGYVQYILLGEFFADKIKDVATMIFTFVGGIAVFAVTKTYQPIKDAVGLYTLLWIYSFFYLVTIISTYFLLVETKIKSFSEIEKEIYG